MRADGRMDGWAVGALAAVLLLSAHPPIRLTAQTDPRLADAVRIAQAGQLDSARAVVSRLLRTLPPTDSVYPEALYTAGILSPEPQLVARNLQRVVVEYGLSPWADDALLRLTQFHFAQGDPAATVQAAERLRRDYPDSPLRARAAFPAARAYFDLKDEPNGCALIREALEGAGEDVEFKNQVRFYAARCMESSAAPTTSIADTAARRDTAAGTPPAPSAFTVQVLAVRSAAQVDELLTRLKVMGFDARVVRDTSGLFKVRVGRYATREEAHRVQARLKTRLGGQPFVVEEP
ncbi:MAG: SPOR domain-containing protein [Gemmatimonadetes bacterium]|nr:SPOR domain-containing protein [Gemmatimonadota bacterium]